MKLELPKLPDLRMDLALPEVQSGADIAALLADRNRAGIMVLLRSGPHCVCEMAAALGQAQNNISNHLARLRDAGLVRPSRIGADSRRVYYERDAAACAAALEELAKVIG